MRKKIVRIVRLAAFCGILFAVSGCLQQERVQRAWPVMGTYAEIEIEEARPWMIDSAVEAVRGVFERVDRTMSVYQATSEITKINYAAGREPVSVDPWVAELVARGRDAYEQTGGAFSMNVLAPGIRLGLKPAEAMPGLQDEQIPRIGDDAIAVTIDPPSVFLMHSGMGIDLGGIAKGYALDRAALELRRLGVRRFLLSLGRSVYAGTAPLGKKGWPILIEGDDRVRYLRNESISVSRQGVMSAVGHIVDPRSGSPIPDVRWVAVSAKDGWVADMASTAVMVNPGLSSKLTKRYPSINWILIRAAESETRE